MATTPVTASQNVGELSLGSNENKITVTASAVNNYHLSESDQSEAVSVMTGMPDYIPNGDGTYTITGRGELTSKYITIDPILVDGPVTAIGDGAFEGDTDLVSIVIPTSVKTIGSNAFRGCTNLVGITLYDIEHMVIFFKNPGWSTPYACYTYEGTQNLDKFPGTVFPGVKMDLLDADKNIYSCKVPLTISTISFNAGDEYNVTDTYDASNDADEMSNCMFTPSRSSTNSEGITRYGMTPEYHYNPGDDFTEYEGLIIGTNAFYGCSGLQGEFTLPRRTVKVNPGAFNNSGIGTITVPSQNRLQKIRFSAFANCKNLTNVALSNNGLYEIEYSAFEGCTQIAAISLPATLKTIKQRVFYNYNPSAPELTNVSFGSSKYVPSRLSTIGEYAFYGGAIENLIIPSSVKYIGPYAFYCESYAQGETRSYIKFEEAYTWFTSPAATPGAGEMTLLKPSSIYGELGDANTADNCVRFSLTEMASMHWHRLDKMLPPTLKLEGNMLTMTDNLGVAEEFKIYIGNNTEAAVIINPNAT